MDGIGMESIGLVKINDMFSFPFLLCLSIPMSFARIVCDWLAMQYVAIPANWYNATSNRSISSEKPNNELRGSHWAAWMPKVHIDTC